MPALRTRLPTAEAVLTQLLRRSVSIFSILFTTARCQSLAGQHRAAGSGFNDFLCWAGLLVSRSISLSCTFSLHMASAGAHCDIPAGVAAVFPFRLFRLGVVLCEEV